MNLHGLVSGAIGTINPFVPVTVQVSTGYTKSADHRQVPSYAAPVTVQAQVQPFSYKDIQQTSGMNLQGTRKAFYLYGKVDGLVRDTEQGGDLITMADGTVWLVALISEQWFDGDTATWVKALATLQNTPAS